MRYDEGGYAVLAIADTMYKEGKTIIAVHSGGGSLRLSSVQFSFPVRQLMEDTFFSERR